MSLPREGHLLRIFIGESDTYEGKALFEWLVRRAREEGLAGATVVRLAPVSRRAAGCAAGVLLETLRSDVVEEAARRAISELAKHPSAMCVGHIQFSFRAGDRNVCESTFLLEFLFLIFLLWVWFH